MRFFLDELDFRLDAVTPADDPAFAQLSGHGLNVALDGTYEGDPGTLRLTLPGSGPRAPATAPNGTRIEFVPADAPLDVPPPSPRASIRPADTSDSAWTRGRAGMLYRDLVPDRAGGYLIASHIRIPDGGPVPDTVHYHAIGFQFIYCRYGWVRLVYEDQGEPFVLEAGDCVLQPPRIRHRVLEASDGLEVIELASPATHQTRLDHDMRLPTPHHRPQRNYSGQTFVLHQLKNAKWELRSGTGIEARDIGLKDATGGLADVCVLRCADANSPHLEAALKRDGAFTFLVALQGSVDIGLDDQPETRLAADGACVIPAGSRVRFGRCTPDLELLEVALPTA